MFGGYGGKNVFDLVEVALVDGIGSLFGRKNFGLDEKVSRADFSSIKDLRTDKLTDVTQLCVQHGQ